LLQLSMGDLAALAETSATKELIKDAFHVPTPPFTSSTNLANLPNNSVLGFPSSTSMGVVISRQAR